MRLVKDNNELWDCIISLFLSTLIESSPNKFKSRQIKQGLQVWCVLILIWRAFNILTPQTLYKLPLYLRQYILHHTRTYRLATRLMKGLDLCRRRKDFLRELDDVLCIKMNYTILISSNCLPTSCVSVTKWKVKKDLLQFCDYFWPSVSLAKMVRHYLLNTGNKYATEYTSSHMFMPSQTIIEFLKSMRVVPPRNWLQLLVKDNVWFEKSTVIRTIVFSKSFHRLTWISKI